MASGDIVKRIGALPENMSDADATKLGHYQYLSSGSYYGSGAPSISASGWATILGVFVPYQMTDGTWRLRFNIRGNDSSGGGDIQITISGVIFTTVSNGQAVLCNALGVGGGEAGKATVNSGTNTLYMASDNLTPTGWTISGDVGLDDIPDWAWR